MKKLYTLALALLTVITVSAQSTGKNGSESNSTGGKTTYHSASNINSGKNSSNSGSVHVSSSTQTQTKISERSGASVTKVRHIENRKVKTETPVKEKTVAVNEENSTEGIKKADRATDYPLYEENGKGSQVNSNTSSTQLDGDQNNTNKSTQDSVNYGWSATKTTFENNGIRPNGVIVTCDEMRASRDRRIGILSAYEQYDLSQIQRCYDGFPAEERWMITCDEFERSSTERKHHIVKYREFYNLNDIIGCESFNEFMKSFTPETKE